MLMIRIDLRTNSRSILEELILAKNPQQKKQKKRPELRIHSKLSPQKREQIFDT